jgi:fumarate hydratase class II
VQDTFGAIEVPPDVLWGTQTARSLHYFAIGSQRMPLDIIQALGWVKWAAARTNADLHLLEPTRAAAIAQAAEQVAQAADDTEFPLSVWQTGSGTHSNMNVNEVVATLANRTLSQVGKSAGDTQAPLRVHPNDDVNRGQSSNDVFPTAMHIAAALRTHRQLLPALDRLHQVLLEKAVLFRDVVKIGRTHLQDATPITLGNEFSGYAAQLALCHQGIARALQGVCSLAIGGTAVGTGLNTHPEFGHRVAASLASRLGLPFTRAANLFAAMAGHEALVALHASLRMLAIALTKVASDVRLMGSGPRAGIGEIELPQNEPGSSIMPGKVNPSQTEALAMVCIQVMGHDTAVGFAASQGQFELNVYKPLIALNVQDSLRLLTDAMDSFREHCVAGIAVRADRVEENLQRSLMLVTALAPHIGYDRSAAIARQAHSQGITLREAALASNEVAAIDFDNWVDPRKMLGPLAGTRSPIPGLVIMPAPAPVPVA